MVRRLLVTGFKSHELGIFDAKHPGLFFIKLAIENRLRALIEDEELEWVIISGQQGTELWTAEVVLELKKEYPNLKLSIITPFIDHDKKWNEEKQEHYAQICQQADFVKSLSSLPYTSPQQFKTANQFMFNHTDGALMFYDDERESTAKFMYADAKRLMESSSYYLSTISSYDLQALVEDEAEKNRTDW